MLTHTLAMSAAVGASVMALGMQRYILGTAGLLASSLIYLATKHIKTDS